MLRIVSNYPSLIGKGSNNRLIVVAKYKVLKLYEFMYRELLLAYYEV